MTEWQEKYDMEIDAIETSYSNELRDVKNIFSFEVECLSAIIQRQ